VAAKGFEAVKAYQELTSYLVEVEGISRKRGGWRGGYYVHEEVAAIFWCRDHLIFCCGNVVKIHESTVLRKPQLVGFKTSTNHQLF